MEYYCYACGENAEVNIMGNTIRCLECGSDFIEEMPDDHEEHAEILRLPSLPEAFDDVDGQLEELHEGLSSLLSQYALPTSSQNELSRSSNNALPRWNGPGIQHRYNLRSSNHLESNRNNVSNVPHSSGDNSVLRQPSRELAPISEANETRAPVRVPVRNAAVRLEQPPSLSAWIRNNGRTRNHSNVVSGSGRRNHVITQRVPSIALPRIRMIPPSRRGAHLR
ncbi:zinc-ribbon domain-containing protein [Ditylenchus destructor]|uniref:Zinc-ribbon domain-containing protein n=1 Tax=Ditylenchus destructor TaxID=166010 RepID=A0AAD4R849_9BILA|nr:zinc-ribbon domain-containing protein [Ditylenchus destructor]